MLVEWCERAGDWLPRDRWEIVPGFVPGEAGVRRVEILRFGEPVGAAASAGGGGVRGEGGGRVPAGWVLGIETSWRVGSVAVGEGGVVAARRFLTTPSAHASGLIPAIEEMLGEVGIGPGELAGVVVGAGPGSFTGIRIGGAAAKGLATSLGVPL